MLNYVKKTTSLAKTLGQITSLANPAFHAEMKDEQHGHTDKDGSTHRVLQRRHATRLTSKTPVVDDVEVKDVGFERR